MIRDIEAISQVVHEAVRTWSHAHRQSDIPPWGTAPEWMRISTRESVQFVLDHPDAGPGAQHEQWMQQRIEAGWVYGATRDEALKQHPMLVPFEALPEFEKQKDALVCAIVRALA